MKHIVWLIVMIGAFLNAQQKDVSVDPSVHGLQIGVLGIWWHNEIKLTNSIALRAEAGFDGGFGRPFLSDNTVYALMPILSLEPRYYFNLKRRVRKGRRIDGNSGNFISLNAKYYPDWFVISNEDANVISSISFVPTLGIRRHIGKHFNYEAGIGVGKNLKIDNEIYREQWGTAVNIHLRIGYRF